VASAASKAMASAQADLAKEKMDEANGKNEDESVEANRFEEIAKKGSLIDISG